MWFDSNGITKRIKRCRTKGRSKHTLNPTLPCCPFTVKESKYSPLVHRAETVPLWKFEVPSTAIVKVFASLSKNIHAWHSFLVVHAEPCLVTRCKVLVRCFQVILRNRLVYLTITVDISVSQTSTISETIQ